MIKNQIVRHWIPTPLCAFLVYLYVIRDSSYSDNWRFISISLTMCFYFVSGITYSMQKQIQNLEAEVQQLRKLRKEPNEDA
jgi:hypothetical protein